MKVLKVHPVKCEAIFSLKKLFHRVNKKNLDLAIKALRQGQIVIFPTETAYGLAGNPFNPEVIDKIYLIKGREFDKPLPLIADSFETVEKYFETNEIEKKLAEKFWPGPLTIVLKYKDDRLGKLNKQGNNIAVRVSSDKLARDLARSLNGLIISTSANVSGEPECYNIDTVVKQFDNIEHKPDVVLDFGKLKKQKPSTIILIKNKKINILRQGEVNMHTT
ncbi:MAG: L-threonylcarbamoyladenylate synthase [Patescibacteria group bacterium]